MKKVMSIILLALLIIILFVISINISHKEQNNQLLVSVSATPYFSSKANKEFFLIAGDINLNSGITIERISPILPKQANDVTFAVLNHTNESITFQNQGFGLSVYRYDDQPKSWKVLHLKYFPNPSPKTLPPKIETWDLDVQKIYAILEDDIVDLGYKQMRLYVSGIGKTTGTEYGAYLDIIVSPSP